MFNKETNAGLKGLVSAASNLVGGGVVSAIGNAVGGLFGNNNTDPAARSLADSYAPGSLIRLGAAPKSWALPGVTDPAPVAGTFYLAIADGLILESKAAGLYPVSDSWAMERQAAWNAAKNQPKTAGAFAGNGMSPVMLVLAGLVVFAVVKR